MKFLSQLYKPLLLFAALLLPASAAYAQTEGAPTSAMNARGEWVQGVWCNVNGRMLAFPVATAPCLAGKSSSTAPARRPSGPTAAERAAVEAARRKAEAAQAARLRAEAEAKAVRSREMETAEQFNREKSDALSSLKGVISGELELKGGVKNESSSQSELKGGGGNTTTEPATSVEKRRLMARDHELSAAIERDIKAIRSLGLNRRSDDFTEWEKLGASAKAEFEKEVMDAATEVVATRATGQLTKSFANFNRTTANRWIKVLEEVDPKPTELIRLVRRVGNIPHKARAVDEAGKIVKEIKLLYKTFSPNDREAWLRLSMDLLCDVQPPPGDKSCKAFKAVSKVTAASLYNNVARHVAINEVKRLTTMTESQLHGLAKINEVMLKHVKERNEVRARIKELNSARPQSGQL